MGDVLELITEIILDIQQFFFRKKLKKRRAYEAANNLPKKRMISPYQRLGVLVVLLIIIIIVFFKFSGVFSFEGRVKKSKQKIIKIQEFLEEEKTAFGTYPKKLGVIIRNNPLRKGILQDAWHNDFKYELLNNGESYRLFSIGKDGTANTEDDIISVLK